MGEFALHSFCDACGRHRRRMPFGDDDSFWDRNAGPCRHCGEAAPGHRHICRRIGWIFKGGFAGIHWADRDGRRVDVPAVELAKPRLREEDS